VFIQERDGLRRVLSSYEAEDGKATKVKIEEVRVVLNLFSLHVITMFLEQRYFVRSFKHCSKNI